MMTRSLTLSTLGLVLLQAAPAAAVTFDFTVDITDGSLLPGQFSGSVQFDELADGGEISPPVISFNFLGETFTEANDIGFLSGLFPRALFEAGTFIGIDYVVDEFSSENPTSIPGETVAFDILANEFTYETPEGFFTGTVNYAQREIEVPESGAAVGLLAAGFSAGWLRRRGQKQKLRWVQSQTKAD